MRLERLLVRGVAFAALIAHVSTADAADVVVISSNVPGIVAGTLLDDAAEVAIPEGARATFLAANGQTVTREGKYHGMIGSGDGAGAGGQSGVLDAIAGLLSPDQSDQSVLGQMRGTAPVEGPGNSLWIDTSRPGQYCVDSNRFLHLWRPQADERRVAKLTDMETSRSAMISWNGGEITHPWPEDLTYRDKAAFLVVVEGAPEPVHVSFRILPRSFDSELQRIAWMVEQGCISQAQLELARFQDSVDPFSLYMTTDRGSKPSYAVGDALNFEIKTNRDSALYCFYTAGDGSTITLFPSQFSNGAWVEGHETLFLPGDRLPVTLSIAPPAGVEIIRCYGTTRDVTRDLPSDLVSGDFRTIDPGLADQIEPTFRGVSDSRLATGEIVVRVR
jgi:hypothetical protein